MPLFQSLDAIAIASPTPAHRSAVARFARGAERYLNRGLRPVPGYSPYPGDRTAGTETWFDDNGWWGLAFLKAYRATGSRRYLADAERALRYIARAGWDPASGGIWWNTEHPYKSGAALASDTLLAVLLYQQTHSGFALAPGAALPGVGERPRLQHRRRALRRQLGEPDPRRLHRGTVDLRAGDALQADRRSGRMRARRAPQGTRAVAVRVPPGLLAAVRRDLRAVDARAVVARRRRDALPAGRRQRPQRAEPRARPSAASTCSPGTARRFPRPTHARACSRPRPRPRACSRGWRSTRRPAEPITGRCARARRDRTRGRAAAV